MQIVASLIAFIVFAAVLSTADAFALSGGKFGQEGWAYGMLYTIMTGPIGYPIISLISHFAFRKKRHWAALFFAVQLAIGAIYFFYMGRYHVQSADRLIIPAVVLGPLLLSAIARELVLLLLEPSRSAAHAG